MPSSISPAVVVHGDCCSMTYPPWKTVYHYFRQWRLAGVWERLNRALLRLVREKLGRSAQPSAAILDSQTVKTVLDDAAAKATILLNEKK